MKEKRVFWLLLIVLFCWAVPDISAYAESAETHLDALETEMNQLQTVENQYDFLKEEMKSFREFMQNETKNYQEQMKGERDGFYTLLSIMVAAASILLTVFTFLIYWQFGQSRKEMHELLELERKRILDKFNTEIEKVYDDMKQKLSQQKEELENRFQVMAEMIDREIRFRQTRILFVGADEQATEMNEQERKLLQQHLFAVEPFSFAETGFEKKLRDRSFDIVIYRYNGGKQGPDLTLRKIVDILITRGEFIPLIIYSKEHIDRNEKDEINERYSWVWLANLPSSLLNHLYTLSHAFTSMNPPEEEKTD